MWRFFVEQRKFTYIITLAIALLGFVSILQIPKESNPEIEIPVITVTTPFPGASPVDVEQFVTDAIEPTLLNLEDVDEITSSSREGVSSIVIEFVIGVDIQEKLSDVREAVDRASSDLPADAEDTLIQRISFDDTPIKIFALSGPYPVNYLRALGEQLQDDLESISGVKRVDLVGGQEREVRVEVDPYTLEQYGLSLTSLAGTIQRANTDIPLGSIETGGSIHTVRFDGRLQDPTELAGLPITSVDGVVVYLGDIATIIDGHEAEVASTRLAVLPEAPNPAVSLSIIKGDGGGDTLDVVKDADEVLANAQEEYLPDNVRIEVVDDFAEYIRTDLINLSTSGLQTTLIVILLILLFLGWREALLAGLAIPTTFFITFIFLTYMGQTLNFLTLFSLILALGILVDGAIVMTEGIYEHVQKGTPPRQAAIDTINEFKAPLIAGTLTTVFAFLPMMLASGLIGEFIKSIPVTVSIVLFGSMFVALALIPTFAVPLLTPRRPKPARALYRFKNWLVQRTAPHMQKPRAVLSYIRTTGFARMQRVYLETLGRLLRNKKARKRFAAGLVVAFIVSVALVPFGALKVDMFPSVDEERLYVDVTLPVGTPVSQTEEAMANIETIFVGHPAVESYLLSVGSRSPVTGGTGERYGSAVLNLVEEDARESSIVLAEQFEREMQMTAPRIDVAVSQLGSGPESGAPVEVVITGQDLTELERITGDLARALEDIEGTRNVSTSIDQTNGTFVFSIDRAAAARHGVSPLEVASTMRTVLFGTTATTIKTASDDLDVVLKVRLNQEAGTLSAPRIHIGDVSSVVMQTPTGPVPLSVFVRPTLESSRATVRHTDGTRVASVTSQVADGFTATEIFADIEDVLATTPLPDGYTAGFRGEDEELNQTLADLGKAMIIGIFLIAALLVLQFQSYRQPLYVLTSIPLSLIGVLPGLALIGQPLSFPGMIGIVALAGIVVNNGIILIDRMNENRKRGLSPEDAVLEGASSRLRPVILTTITTIAGMLPLVLSEPSWGPLGFAIIFGLLFSTVSTLLVIPLLYARKQ